MKKIKISNNILIVLITLFLVLSLFNAALLLQFKYPTGKATGLVKLTVQTPPVPPPPAPPRRIVPAPPCEEDWVCTEWPSICPLTEIQTRTCIDRNACGTFVLKPAETRTCKCIIAIPAPPLPPIFAELGTVTSAVLILIVFAIIAFIIFKLLALRRKRLILAGGTGESYSKPINKFFVSLIPKKKMMLYVPIIKPKSKRALDRSYKKIKSIFKPLGFTDIVVWADLNNRKYADLAPFGAIYLGRGKAFSLLYHLKSTGFIKILRQFIKSKRVVYGSSTSAVILGKDIRTTSFRKGADFSGLNVVKNYSIKCYYSPSQDSKTMGFVAKYKLPVIALPKRSGLYVKNGKIKVIGSEPAYVFKKGKKVSFEPNSVIKWF